LISEIKLQIAVIFVFEDLRVSATDRNLYHSFILVSLLSLRKFFRILDLSIKIFDNLKT